MFIPYIYPLFNGFTANPSSIPRAEITASPSGDKLQVILEVQLGIQEAQGKFVMFTTDQQGN